MFFTKKIKNFIFSDNGKYKVVLIIFRKTDFLNG